MPSIRDRFYLLPVSRLLLAICIIYFACESDDGKALTAIESQVPHKLTKRERIDLAIQHEFDMTHDPALGIVPRERLIEARRELALRLQRPATDKAPIPGIEWVELGPNNVGGRTRALLFDPNDASGNSVIAGGVAGGLWKTTNITQTDPQWSEVDAFMTNLAVTTIAADPSDPQIMYVGTGEGWFNIDATRGDGIFRSSDGGDTWSQLASTAGNTTFQYIQKIVVHPATGDVYAATRGNGVQRSTDDGNSWTTVLSSSNGTVSVRAADLEIAADNTIYASFGIFSTDGVYSSASGDAGSWTQLNTGGNGFPTTGFERIELALAPSNANVVYAFTQDSNALLPGIFNIYRSANAGATWSAVSLPSPADPGQSEYTRGQAWYDLIAAVDPNDEDRVFTGGIDLYVSDDGGTSWTQISDWRGSTNGFQYVHADHHEILFADGSSDIMLFGNDGGVFYSSNGSAAVPTISERNTGYNVTQLYGAAMHPTSGESQFLSGSQDNGSHRYDSPSLASAVEVTGGDGGIPHIDQDQSSFQFTSSTRTTFNRSTDGGLSFSAVISNGGGRFINPSDYDNDANKIYASFNPGQYVIWDDPQSGATLLSATIGLFNGAQPSAVTVSPNTGNRVFFATDEGRVVRVDNAATAPAASWINNGAGMPAAYINCIEVEDGNDDHLLVTYSSFGVNSIWETTDGGTTWNSVEGDLPDMPVRWALFNPANTDQAMIATDLGVWSTDNLDGAATAWDPSNSGLGNVRVDMLQTRTSDDLVIAATHGRGLFSSNVFDGTVTADFSADQTVDYLFNDIQFTDLSSGATSWSWDFGDGSTSTERNPVHEYETAGRFTVSLTINGTTTDTRTDYIHILPNRGTPYEAIDGGDFETNADDFGSMALSGGINPWERGTPTNALTTLNSGSNGWKTDLDANIVDADFSAALLFAKL